MAKIINADAFIQMDKDRRKKMTFADILPSKNSNIATKVVNRIMFTKKTIGLFIINDKPTFHDADGGHFKYFVKDNINNLVGIYDEKITIEEIVDDLRAFQQDKKVNRIIKAEKKGNRNGL